MKNSVPISAVCGVELVPTDSHGICKVLVKDSAARSDLSWDRFVRLKAASENIMQVAFKGAKILDVGGYDGALALFLPEHDVYLMDPTTTGVSLLEHTAGALSFDVVAAIDVLEHIAPHERESSLQELARIARRWIILNYPCRQTAEAQKLVLNVTNNSLIREHVEWELPDTELVLAMMKDFGFSGKVTPHSNVAIWLGQYLALNLAPETSKVINRYLIEHHANDPFSTPLYHLLVCERES